MTSGTTPQRAVWLSYAAAAWAILFGAPHVWWALGIPAGFPGGTGSHEIMLRKPWFVAYDLFVAFLCGVAVTVALGLVQPWGRRVPRWMLVTAAWVACAMLGVRGLAGHIVDGLSDLVWSPTFSLGGLLFGMVAWTARRHGRSA